MKRRTLAKGAKAKKRKGVSGQAISKRSGAVRGRLREIQPFIQTTAQASIRLKGREFVNCLRASLSKSFEFCLEAYKDRTNHIAFFLAPSLRSICEDVVVLSYLANKMSRADRNELVSLLFQQELASQLAAQSKFFDFTRPEQSVIQPRAIDKRKIEDSIRQVWKRNGWAGLISSWKPTIRQIAEKNHIDVLTTLYDYIYRLSSGAVHFNPRVLLRTGWGRPAQFSPKNFSKYYAAYARTYGLFLFCCYFELFGRFLRPNKRVSALITELRFNLLSESRWPEMVTFEELNLRRPEGDVPHYVYRFVDAHLRKRRLLKTPDRATTLRHVKRLLDDFRRHPEDAKRLKTLVDGLRRRPQHAK